MTVENVVNQALDQIGYVRHIGNIYDGSPAARVALNIWAQTRDSLLESLNPDWARKDVALALLRAAPNIQGSTANYTGPWDASFNPPLPWLYEYETPVDCLRPLQIKTQRFFLPVWRPRPNTFRQVTTSTTDTILTNTHPAILTYIARILDPDAWHETFRDAMIQLLARKMQAEFAKSAPPQQRGEQQNADAAS